MALWLWSIGTASAHGESGSSPRLRLGHYSSGDGLTGFVLDRTGSPVKLRVDGSNDVQALTPVASAVGNATRLENGLGRAVVEVSEWGTVRWYATGPVDGTPVYRDGDAKPLPDPPAAPVVTPASLTDATTAVRAKCNTDVAFEVDLASLGNDSEAQRNAQWQVLRAVDVVSRMCRDDIGKKAVKAKLGRVRIKSVPASAKKSVDHQGNVLVLEQPLATTKGATLHEIQGVLDKWL